MIGRTLGPYEVVGKLGAGGMGEVYRATDTKLKREVAIKVLPASVAQDPERLARFQREAEVLAQLNHPHIAAIYGLEDADGIKALVMELVEGPTLAGRIAQGPIPLDEALPIARQIAEALEAAHERGIIHRDLKPANIKVRDDGTVKVLDFGLAKALDPADASSADAANSPTITSPAMTAAGIILGTAAYMAPEQARGKPVDRRADIWAFGCVLYEMLTGARPFDGEDVTELLGAIVKTEPEWSKLPADTPRTIRTLLARCLRKNPRERLDSAAAARLEIVDAAARDEEAASTHAAAQMPRWRRWLPAWTAAAALAFGGLAALVLWPAAAPRFVVRSMVSDPDPLVVASFGPAIAISPDGTHVVYRTRVADRYLTKVRALDSLDALVLHDDPDSTSSATFSPDGAWVAFRADSEIRRVPVAGGPALAIGRTNTQRVDGLAWTDDGFIIFGTGGSSGLLRVAVAGGTPEPLTTVNAADGEQSHAWPVMLPGGRAVLFTIRHRQANTNYDASAAPDSVAVLDLATRTYRVVVAVGHMAHYTATGHLVYSDGSTLLAGPFDADRLEVTGTAVPFATGIATALADSTQFAISDTGTLLYLTGNPEASRTSAPVWVDRHGVAQPIASIEPDDFGQPRLAPDGTRFSTVSNNDAWVFETGNGRRRRLTSDRQATGMVIWSPDGTRVAYTSSRGGAQDTWVQDADGGGEPVRVTSAQASETWFSNSWSPDGDTLAVSRLRGIADVFLLPLTGADRAPRALISRRNSYATMAQYSPDGRYIAFAAGSGAQWSIEVHPATGPGASVPVSVDGGVEPIWGKNGELFYRHPVTHAMMHARVATDGDLTVGTPERLFDAAAYVGFEIGAPGAWYDVTADGQRFLMLRPVDDTASPQQLVFVQNWFEELKRMVPVK